MPTIQCPVTPAAPTTPERIFADHRQCGSLNGYDGCYSHPVSGDAHCRQDGMDWPCDVELLRAARSTPAEALDVEWLRRDIEKIDHPCHDACIGNLHADCQCAAWIRQEVLLLLSPHNREADHEDR